jgi:hypothetical protein
VITTINEKSFGHYRLRRAMRMSPGPQFNERESVSVPRTETIRIPDGVIAMGRSAFSSYPNLFQDEFGRGPASWFIKEYTFRHSSFRSIHLPSSLKRVEHFVFAGCMMLRHISFSESFIGGSAIFAYSGTPLTFIELLWRFQTTFAVIVYHLAKSAPDVS